MTGYLLERSANFFKFSSPISPLPILVILMNLITVLHYGLTEVSCEYESIDVDFNCGFHALLITCDSIEDIDDFYVIHDSTEYFYDIIH